jgi:hypothetical protein
LRERWRDKIIAVVVVSGEESHPNNTFGWWTADFCTEFFREFRERRNVFSYLKKQQGPKTFIEKFVIMHTIYNTI